MSDKIPLKAEILTLRDLKRAKVVLEGRDPFEVLGSGEQLEIAQLIGWCVRSRDDPEYGWDDAADLNLSDFEFGGDSDEPPPTASPAEPGGSDATSEPPSSTTRPPKRARKASSGSSSA